MSDLRKRTFGLRLYFMPKLYKGECEQCRNSYKGRGLRFCSNSCRVTWTNLHRNVAKRPEVRAKIAAQAKKDGRQAQLMTRQARTKANEGISRAHRGRTLTEEHKAAIGRGVRKAGIKPPLNTHLVGPRHPSWKGGTSTLRNKDFGSSQYRAFRNAVLRIDNFICRDCGDKNTPFVVHHEKSWAEHPGLRYDVGNGVTLCRPCHYARHRSQPRPKSIGPRVLSDLLTDQS